jgi:hypothetical protein
VILGEIVFLWMLPLGGSRGINSGGLSIQDARCFGAFAWGTIILLALLLLALAVLVFLLLIISLSQTCFRKREGSLFLKEERR